jgi:DNA-binding Lrp family transcriptional regulator
VERISKCDRFVNDFGIKFHKCNSAHFYSKIKSFMESIDIDETDLRLLDALQTDAALSNLALAERVHVSPPTCLRRVKRLWDAGLIERQVAILNADRLAPVLGHGLSAVVEISLDRQGAEQLDAFEQRVARRGRAAVLPRLAGPGLRADRARGRHAGLPGAGAAPVHQRRQCAQRQGLFQRQAGEI